MHALFLCACYVERQLRKETLPTQECCCKRNLCLVGITVTLPLTELAWVKTDVGRKHNGVPQSWYIINWALYDANFQVYNGTRIKVYGAVRPGGTLSYSDINLPVYLKPNPAF